MLKTLMLSLSVMVIVGCTRNDIQIGYGEEVGMCSSDVTVAQGGFVVISTCKEGNNVTFKVED